MDENAQLPIPYLPQQTMGPPAPAQAPAAPVAQAPVAQAPVAQAAAPAFQMPSMNDYLPMIGQAAQGAAGKDVLEKQIEAKTKLAAAQVQSKNTGMMTMFSLMAANNAATHQANVSRQYGFEKIAASRYGHFAGRETQGANDGSQQATMQAVKMGMSFGQSQAEEKAAQAEHDAWTDPATTDALVKAQTGKYLMEIAPHVMSERNQWLLHNDTEANANSRQNASLSMQEKLRGDALDETKRKNDQVAQGRLDSIEQEALNRKSREDIAAGKGTKSTPVKDMPYAEMKDRQVQVDHLDALRQGKDPKTGQLSKAITPEMQAQAEVEYQNQYEELSIAKGRHLAELAGITDEQTLQDTKGVGFRDVGIAGSIPGAQRSHAAITAKKKQDDDAYRRMKDNEARYVAQRGADALRRGVAYDSKSNRDIPNTQYAGE